MKSWRKWLRGLAVLAGVTMTVVAVAGFFLPSSLVVERERLIPAAAQDLYDRVASLRRWPEWATWWQREPFLDVRHAGPETGAGASMAWRSKHEGEGRARIMSVSPAREVALAFDFGERGDARSVIQFKESPGQPQTRVKWTFRTDFGGNSGRRYFGMMVRPWLEKEIDESLSKLEAATLAKSSLLPQVNVEPPEKLPEP